MILNYLNGLILTQFHAKKIRFQLVIDVNTIGDSKALNIQMKQIVNFILTLS